MHRVCQSRLDLKVPERKACPPDRLGMSRPTTHMRGGASQVIATPRVSRAVAPPLRDGVTFLKPLHVFCERLAPPPPSQVPPSDYDASHIGAARQIPSHHGSHAATVARPMEVSRRDSKRVSMCVHGRITPHGPAIRELQHTGDGTTRAWHGRPHALGVRCSAPGRSIRGNAGAGGSNSSDFGELRTWLCSGPRSG
jgi:hypothetical protein